ncbi:hypothetical protein M9H77_25874 [Catharanthus roseus]|uniref:Uncharacterized protein n=1 Tax=Catharanthus roseus TaxID=4058 RepID=A0ACC0A919_CATRO|nr:hypothetical protein M9H77_25874 [Catharanthus roseus]
MLVRVGQDESDKDSEDDDGNKGQEEMNVHEEDKERNMHKRSLKGILHRSKRSLKTTRVYEDEVIKLNTLKTRRLVKDILKNNSEKPLALKSKASLALEAFGNGEYMRASTLLLD